MASVAIVLSPFIRKKAKLRTMDRASPFPRVTLQAPPTNAGGRYPAQPVRVTAEQVKRKERKERSQQVHFRGQVTPLFLARQRNATMRQLSSRTKLALVMAITWRWCIYRIYIASMQFACWYYSSSSGKKSLDAECLLDMAALAALAGPEHFLPSA